MSRCGSTLLTALRGASPARASKKLSKLPNISRVVSASVPTVLLCAQLVSGIPCSYRDAYANVRLQQHIVCFEEPRMHFWLLLKDVQSCSAQMPTLECYHQGFFVDYWTASCVDKPRSLLHLSQLCCRDEMPCRFGQRDVDRHDITLRKQVLEFLNVGRPSCLCGGDCIRASVYGSISLTIFWQFVSVVVQNFHAEGLHVLAGDSANAAHANDS